MNVRLIPSTASLLSVLAAACAGGPARRVETSGVPLAGTAAPTATGAATRRTAADAPMGATAATLDHGFERRLRVELGEQLAAAGRPALELIDAGTSVESRLRFAVSRILLDRFQEAEIALTAVVRDVPDCALASFMLGQLRRRQGNGGGAVEALQRARAMEVERHLTPHPDLGIELALSTLLAGDSDEGLRLLRAELAGGANRVRAAETLARIAADGGEFEDALAAVDAVLDDEPDQPALAVAKVDVLVDQLRFDEAMAAIDRHGGRLAPAERMHLRALVAWRRGDLTGAAAQARDAVASLAGTPEEQSELGVELRRRVSALEADVAKGGRQNATYRELLGRLRYSEREVDRVTSLRLLCERGSALAARAAVHWAMADTSVTVRAMVFRVSLARVPDHEQLIARGLSDPDVAVRSAAAGAVTSVPAQRPALVEALAREADAETYLTMHRVLRRMTDTIEFLPYGGEKDAATRARIAERWRQELATQGEKRSKT